MCAPLLNKVGSAHFNVGNTSRAFQTVEIRQEGFLFFTLFIS